MMKNQEQEENTDEFYLTEPYEFSILQEKDEFEKFKLLQEIKSKEFKQNKISVKKAIVLKPMMYKN